MSPDTALTRMARTALRAADFQLREAKRLLAKSGDEENATQVDKWRHSLNDLIDKLTTELPEGR